MPLFHPAISKANCHTLIFSLRITKFFCFFFKRKPPVTRVHSVDEGLTSSLTPSISFFLFSWSLRVSQSLAAVFHPLSPTLPARNTFMHACVEQAVKRAWSFNGHLIVVCTIGLTDVHSPRDTRQRMGGGGGRMN